MGMGVPQHALMFFFQINSSISIEAKNIKITKISKNLAAVHKVILAMLLKMISLVQIQPFEKIWIISPNVTSSTVNLDGCNSRDDGEMAAAA